MGFIDWHKNKKDHYEDVLDYAKAQREEEDRSRKDRLIRQRMGEMLGEPRYAGIKPAEVLRLLICEAQALKNTYMELAGFQRQNGSTIDSELLWKDWWTVSIDDILERQKIEEGKRTALLQAAQDRIFRLNAPLSAKEYDREKTNNKRYRRYLENCFLMRRDAPMYFLRYVCLIGAQSAQRADDMLQGFCRCKLLLSYYFYLSSAPGEDWILGMEDEAALISDLRRRCGKESEPDRRKLQNPLFAKRSEGLDRLTRAAKILLFNFRKKTARDEGEMRMIEELYTALEDGALSFERIESILPDGVKEQILRKQLPSFPRPELQGFDEDERLYYVNHAVLYQGIERDDEVVFRSRKGSVYFTDRRVIFRGGSQMSIPYESVERVIEYDLLPQMLEVVSEGKSCFFQLPDVETAYQALKLIANRNRGKHVDEVRLSVTYEELVNNADLGACIFELEHLLSGEIDESLEEQIKELIPKLKCLEKTIVQYPEKREDVYQFLHYYVPEAVRVAVEYQRYHFAGVDENALEGVRRKVLEAIRTLNLAVLKKVAEIYGFAMMDTIAQAEALREILGQDGYAAPSYTMK